MAPVITLNLIDYAIIAGYILVMVLVGYSLKKYMKTGEDFFLSGRSLPGWITGLAFLSANLGALEVIGMVANSAKYGIATVHFYWVGAIPAMVFLGIFMMPFYYGSRVRTVPEYLKLRYNEATRGLNAVSFADHDRPHERHQPLRHGPALQDHARLAAHAEHRLRGGRRPPLRLLGRPVLVDLQRGHPVLPHLARHCCLSSSSASSRSAASPGFAAKLQETLLHSIKYLGTSNNPLGVDWFGVVMGLGFVLSFGYWTTDFLVVQRALASKNLNSARMTPIIAAFPKMLVPIIVVIPGLVALLVLPEFAPAALPTADYNSALILLMKHYLPNGILGLAITALLASFMSGMAGNVTAFNTIWTYDIYGTYIRKGRPDAHYLKVGKYTTVIGVAISVGTAYIVQSFPNLMDYMQLIFSFFNAPLFATFLLGMFWKGATGWGGFWGLLVGILTAAGHYILYKTGVLTYHSDMAANFYQAIWAWLADFVVTIGVSLFTAKRDPKELVGLVFGLTPKPKAEARWYARPAVWGTLAVIVAIVLNVIFW